MPLVSVVMPVFNGEKYVAEAIESILTQTFTDFEFIIVDDGSQDRSAEIIRSYEARDDRIRIIQLEHNMGLSDARNRGIAVANGEFITSMDCDDISLPERLRKQVDFLQARSEIGGVGVSAIKVSEDLSKTLREYRLPECHSLIVFAQFIGASLVDATMMYRRAYLRAVGGFEPGLRHGSDRELVIRLLSKTQIRFANITERLLLYRHHTSALSLTEDSNLIAQVQQVFEMMLNHVWNEAPAATLDRFARLRRREKLTWAERQAAKRDMRRLIDSLIDKGWVEPGDKSLLLRAMDRRLEIASPRLWQQFCHWRRHHFGGVDREVAFH